MAVRKVGTSRINREIGRGGMSIVYEGYQEALDRKVAVKALELAGSRADELEERFRREGRAYAQIHHANIIAVHDLVEKDDALYLVVEYVDGADLDRVLAHGGAFPPECVAAVGARLADALDCVHAHNLVHRDVKPGNVMIARDGAVKLMDFGIAKDLLLNELTKTGVVVGTPHYLAPEVLGGDPEDERSDVWSVGITLYQLATGERPFAGATYSDLFGAVRKGKVRAVRRVAPGVPRRLARTIERCMERNPDRRWESAGVLAEELSACAAELLGEVAPQVRLARLLAERGVFTVDPGTVVVGTSDLVPATGSSRLAVPGLGRAGRRLYRLSLYALVALGAAALAWGFWTGLLTLR